MGKKEKENSHPRLETEVTFLKLVDEKMVPIRKARAHVKELDYKDSDAQQFQNILNIGIKLKQLNGKCLEIIFYNFEQMKDIDAIQIKGDNNIYARASNVKKYTWCLSQVLCVESDFVTEGVESDFVLEDIV